jgi:dihydrolipoamide dehydrogenase
MNGYDYDVIVVGAGSPLADGGLRVAMVERELAGGEVLVLGVYPVQDAAAPR